MLIALEARSLTVHRSDKLVLNDLSFEIAQGEIYALLGGNGAGKSTTLLTFLGFLKPTKGSVSVLGQNVDSSLQKARQSITYVPESARMYGHLNAYENIKYFLSLSGKRVEQSEIDKAFKTVLLAEDARANRLDSYSKGMCQKVAIALAILRAAPIMLLDEPTAGLDPIAIDEFNNLVRKLATSGKTVLMVTHDVYGACQVADKIGLLRHGKFVGNFARDGDQQIDTESVHSAFAGRAVA